MAELGRYRIPKEFKDEDKWFKFFTKRQLIYAIVTLAVDAMLLILFASMHLTLIGIVLAELITIISLTFAFVEIPSEKYMYGGGLKLSTILLRVVVRKLPKNRVIYVKNYDDEVN